MSHTNIVLIGHVCIDHNKTENATYDGWGSSVLYMSQYYQKNTGAVPAVISSYGPDMLEYLPEVTMLPAAPNRPATLLYENDTSGSVRIWKCRNVAVAAPPAITPDMIALLQQVDIVVVATLLPNYTLDYLQEILSHARAGSLKVLCPQGYLRHVAPDSLVQPREFVEATGILPLFDLIIYSEEDHPRAMSLATDWKQSIAGTIIVTQGQNGATIVGGSQPEHIPTTPIPPAEIIDSVGCGDVFAGAAALEYFHTKNLPKAVRAAHKAAAKKLKATIKVKD